MKQQSIFLLVFKSSTASQDYSPYGKQSIVLSKCQSSKLLKGKNSFGKTVHSFVQVTTVTVHNARSLRATSSQSHCYFNSSWSLISGLHTPKATGNSTAEQVATMLTNTV